MHKFPASFLSNLKFEWMSQSSAEKSEKSSQQQLVMRQAKSIYFTALLCWHIAAVEDLARLYAHAFSDVRNRTIWQPESLLDDGNQTARKKSK